ncbi:hypothetical protein ABRQ22_14740 [Cellulosimicrobium sp. ES-005]|uniref:Uncharacterized protein n=1 Tax=Cellulosimicrobium sp. ES-005 TaxID=3163031 RepID=A0AAU8FW80_9MICO
MGLFNRKKVDPLDLPLEERAQIASLNGSNALAVFEEAAYALDASARDLQEIASQAHELADITLRSGELEAEAILTAARARADELKVTGISLDEEAAGHVRRAVKIRELVGA